MRFGDLQDLHLKALNSRPFISKTIYLGDHACSLSLCAGNAHKYQPVKVCQKNAQGQAVMTFKLMERQLYYHNTQTY